MPTQKEPYTGSYTKEQMERMGALSQANPVLQRASGAHRLNKKRPSVLGTICGMIFSVRGALAVTIFSLAVAVRQHESSITASSDTPHNSPAASTASPDADSFSSSSSTPESKVIYGEYLVKPNEGWWHVLKYFYPERNDEQIDALKDSVEDALENNYGNENLRELLNIRLGERVVHAELPDGNTQFTLLDSNTCVKAVIIVMRLRVRKN